jgi:hypothetical protein
MDEHEYISAGLDEAVRYASFARESIDEQIAVIRSAPPPTPQQGPPPVPAGSMWAAAATSAEALQRARTADVAMAARVAKTANSLGIPLPPDIAERAILDDEGPR